MNTITKMQFLFNMQSESFARTLYGRWDSFFMSSVERVADEVLSKYSQKDEHIEIDLLELDLGAIEEEKYDDQFPFRFREKLDEALSKCLFDVTEKQKIKRISQKENTFQLLCQFLLHGTLSWNASGTDRDIHVLFLRVIQENGAAFKRFLQTYGHYTSLQQRLVYHLNDPELEKGIHLLSLDGGDFIISYVRFLRVKYKETQQPETTESNYRDAVWLVVYAYLLSQRSAYFDKKSFITQTILNLAGKYNLSYDSLLYLLTRELSTFRQTLSVSPELFHILEELQKELSEKQLKASAVDAAKFYKTVYLSFKKEVGKQMPESTREALFLILGNPSSCRSFLQQLTEQEVFELVLFVIPNDSDFVIDVAKSLDRQKEQGELQGRAGGEFRLLKWQIIFPLLLEKRETGFNRKQFVRSVFRQVAVHYNIDVTLLLNYFVFDSTLPKWADRELQQILAILWKDVEQESIEKKEHEITGDETSLRFLLNTLMEIENMTELQIRNVLRLLSKSNYRKRITDQTREQERFRLVRLIYPKEQEFIVQYIEELNKIEFQHLLEAGAGGGFADLKWIFLFTVFSEMPGDNFNRRHFVRSVLQQTAAHYNLNYFDLLLYFHLKKVNVHLPFRLEQIVEELFSEEQHHWLKIILRIPIEADRYSLLTILPQVEQGFLKNYLHSLDYCQEKGRIQGRLSGNFKELKWRFTFDILIKLKDIAFNKKQFILATLCKIAAHYHLQLEELLVYFRTTLESSTNTAFVGISAILDELYTQEIEYKNQSKKGLKPAEIKQHKNTTEKKSNMKELVNEDIQTSYISNAGLILLAPFLPRLFCVLELTENNAFKSQEAQIRATCILQYIVLGQTEFPDFDLLLNKLLTGLGIEEPIPLHVELSAKEIDTINQMLQSVLQHWTKLKNTSVNGLREAFLQRDGKLEEREDNYMLTVEEKAFDMLLDSLPWSFRMTKFSWMEKSIQVKWR